MAAFSISSLHLFEQRAFEGNESILSQGLSERELRRAFWYAAYGGQISLMDELQKRVSITKLINATCRGDTPLHAAARRAHINVIKYLLDLGMYVNVRNKHGQTPLVALLLEKDDISDSDKKAAAQYLLSAGAFLDLRDDFGNTPRSLLRKRGWEIPELSKQQRLFQAIDMGSIKELSTVLEEFEQGSPPILGGETPFHRVLHTASNSAVFPLSLRLLEMKKAMIEMLAKKFDIYTKNHWDQTPHQLAETGLQIAQKSEKSKNTILLLEEIISLLKPPQAEEEIHSCVLS